MEASINAIIVVIIIIMNRKHLFSPVLGISAPLLQCFLKIIVSQDPLIQTLVSHGPCPCSAGLATEE